VHARWVPPATKTWPTRPPTRQPARGKGMAARSAHCNGSVAGKTFLDEGAGEIPTSGRVGPKSLWGESDRLPSSF